MGLREQFEIESGKQLSYGTVEEYIVWLENKIKSMKDAAEDGIKKLDNQDDKLHTKSPAEYYNNVEPVGVVSYIWSSVSGYNYKYCGQRYPDEMITIGSKKCEECKYYCYRGSDRVIYCNAPFYTWNKKT